jgi:hypothetical protein
MNQEYANELEDMSIITTIINGIPTESIVLYIISLIIVVFLKAYIRIILKIIAIVILILIYICSFSSYLRIIL